jgi:hypothetical protein
MANPVSRLMLARIEVDRVFGDGFAMTNPSLVAAVVASAASDHAAACVATALERSAHLIADALAGDLPDAIIRPAELCR